jgi:uncharacterized protein YdhG (YjbR/CyaY superfamily)
MPTENPVPAQFALQSVLAGLTARKALAAYREAGGHVANQTWFQLRGEMERMVSAREGIYSEPQHLKPVASEIQQWTTAKARGYIQQVEVLVRERETGTVVSVPYSSVSNNLRSRAAVTKEALDVYSDDNAKKYNQQILGAVYSGTYQAVPAGEQ